MRHMFPAYMIIPIHYWQRGLCSIPFWRRNTQTLLIWSALLVIRQTHWQIKLRRDRGERYLIRADTRLNSFGQAQCCGSFIEAVFPERSTYFFVKSRLHPPGSTRNVAPWIWSFYRITIFLTMWKTRAKVLFALYIDILFFTYLVSGKIIHIYF